MTPTPAECVPQRRPRRQGGLRFPRPPRRYGIFLTVSAAFGLAMFQRMGLAAIAGSLRGELGLNAEQLGLLGSSYFYIYAAMQLPLGLIVDRGGTARPGGAFGDDSAGDGGADQPLSASGRGLSGAGVPGHLRRGPGDGGGRPACDLVGSLARILAFRAVDGHELGLSWAERPFSIHTAVMSNRWHLFLAAGS